MYNHKWIRYASTFLLMIIVAELFLFTAGWFLTIFKNPTLSPNWSQEKTIVTLGESTTADGGSPGAESWPQILQKKFHNKNEGYNIVNLARVGVVSTNLVQNFFDKYSTLKPHLVVTMMGINDMPNFWMKKAGLIASDNILNNLRVIKLLNFFIFSVQHKFNYEQSPLDRFMDSPPKKTVFVNRSHLDYPEPDELIRQIKNQNVYFENRIYEFLKEKSNIEKAQFYAWISNSIRPPWQKNNEVFRPSYEYIKKSIEISLEVKFALEEFILLATWLDPQACDWVAKRILDEAVPISESTASRLANCLPKSKSVRSVIEKWNGNFEVRSFVFSKPTADNFNRLFNFLEIRGVCLIVMQYPLLEIKKMKKYFINHKSPYLFFVENKVNFERLLSFHKYEDVFSDRFAERFGHAKQMGNELIAESVLPAIENALDQPHCQNPQW